MLYVYTNPNLQHVFYDDESDPENFIGNGEDVDYDALFETM